jgi:hypothetical protein
MVWWGVVMKIRWDVILVGLFVGLATGSTIFGLVKLFAWLSGHGSIIGFKIWISIVCMVAVTYSLFIWNEETL